MGDQSGKLAVGVRKCNYGFCTGSVFLWMNGTFVGTMCSDPRPCQPSTCE